MSTDNRNTQTKSFKQRRSFGKHADNYKIRGARLKNQRTLFMLVWLRETSGQRYNKLYQHNHNSLYSVQGSTESFSTKSLAQYRAQGDLGSATSPCMSL